jgi:hypothetical protein
MPIVARRRAMRALSYQTFNDGRGNAAGAARLAFAHALIDGYRIVDEMRSVIFVDISRNGIDMRGREFVRRVDADKYQDRVHYRPRQRDKQTQYYEDFDHGCLLRQLANFSPGRQHSLRARAAPAD